MQFSQQDSLTEWLRQAGAGNRPPTFRVTRSLGHIIFEKCKPKVCVANNLDENVHTVAHTREHFQCQLHKPELLKVIQTIKDGDIPLISISLTPEGESRLTVLNASPDVQYTAISHLWIGDLGNFPQSRLPRCQLLRTHSLLKSAERQTQAENLFKPSLTSLKTRITFLCKPISDLYGVKCASLIGFSRR